MNKPKLTLAVPTYNSYKTLAVALESIMNQQVSLSDIGRLEVIIIDNCSTDETHNFCKQYISNLGIDCKYYRNSENIGYDRNIDLLFEKSNGDFVKILCDDDALMPGALQKFYDSIDEHPDAVVFISNFDTYDITLTNVINTLKVCDGKAKIFDDINEFLKSAMGRYGQTSSLMANREAWLQIPSENAIGSLHIQVYKTLHLLDLGPGLVDGRASIKVRTGSPNFLTSPESSYSVPLKGLQLLFEYKKSHPNTAIESLLNEQAMYVASLLKAYHSTYRLSPDLVALHNKLVSEHSKKRTFKRKPKLIQ